ncbi:MAG: hypothetical protein ACP5OA_02970 [Candidatus Woesearchaeota archaeon]
MAEEQADYSQVYDFLYRIERRIGYLEKDAAFIEKQVASLDEKKLKSFGMLNIEFVELQSNLLEVKNHLGKCAHAMSMLSKDMKSAVKKDDLQLLNAHLDTIPFEEYITRKDLERGLLD